MKNSENLLKKPKLWVISELFPPEETSTAYIMGEVSQALLRKYDVSVICGPEVYDEKKVGNYSKDESGYSEIVRVAHVNENKKSSLSRARKFLLMSWRLYREAKKRVNKGETVFMVSNPFPLILLMSHIKKKKSIRLVMLVHDIFPEGLYTDMHLPRFVYRVLSKFFNRAYSIVDTLISLGRDMSDVLATKVQGQKDKPQIIQIENWGDTENIGIKQRSDSNTITIEYAGNVGHAQGVDLFCKQFASVSNENLAFSIWGTGSALDDIREMVATDGISNVQVYGAYTRDRQDEVLNQCDLALITLVDGMYGLGVPSKSYNVMAAGKPILFIGDLRSEIALTVAENNIGFCFQPSDSLGLSSFLKSLSKKSLPELRQMGLRARELVERKYSKQVILDKFIEVI